MQGTLEKGLQQLEDSQTYCTGIHPNGPLKVFLYGNYFQEMFLTEIIFEQSPTDRRPPKGHLIKVKFLERRAPKCFYKRKTVEISSILSLSSYGEYFRCGVLCWKVFGKLFYTEKYILSLQKSPEEPFVWIRPLIDRI